MTDNLFFRKDDGSVLAVRISSTLGLELLRGLSQQISPLTHLPALPFALAPSTTTRDDLADDAQGLSLATSTSTAPYSSVPVPSRTTSTSARTSVSATSAALSGMSMANSSTGTINTEAWVDGIFSLADGKPYDRDWIHTYNVKDDVLKGPPSKHKLDLLVRHGAVIVGDKLCVTYHSSGNPVTIEGEVSLQIASIAMTTPNLISYPGPARLYEHKLVRPNRAASSGIRRRSPIYPGS